MTLPFRHRSPGRSPVFDGDFPDDGQSATEVLERIRPASWDGTTITFGGASAVGVWPCSQVYQRRALSPRSGRPSRRPDWRTVPGPPARLRAVPEPGETRSPASWPADGRTCSRSAAPPRRRRRHRHPLRRRPPRIGRGHADALRPCRRRRMAPRRPRPARPARSCQAVPRIPHPLPGHLAPPGGAAPLDAGQAGDDTLGRPSRRSTAGASPEHDLVRDVARRRPPPRQARGRCAMTGPEHYRQAERLFGDHAAGGSAPPITDMAGTPRCTPRSRSPRRASTAPPCAGKTATNGTAPWDASRTTRR